MTSILLAALTAFSVTFLIIPVIIQFSKKKKRMMDKPGRRKIHKKRTPSLGGIGIFVGFFTALLVWIPLDEFQSYKYILGAISIIFIIGMRDDIVALKPIYKLIGQIIAASLVVTLAGVQITSLYGIFGVYELPEWISIALSVFTIIVVTNSFNLIDGLDGLAGTIATVALLTFGIWFYLTDQELNSLLAYSMVGSIIAFLKFNWEPSKIFMGDTGALVIGFLFAILAIFFIDNCYHMPFNAPYKFNSPVAVGVAVVIIPLLDTLRIFILRLWKKQSPFTPDKNHVHHALMRLGLSHSQTALTLGATNIFYIALAISLDFLGDNILLLVIILVATGLSLLLDYSIIQRLKRH